MVISVALVEVLVSGCPPFETCERLWAVYFQSFERCSRVISPGSMYTKSVGIYSIQPEVLHSQVGSNALTITAPVGSSLEPWCV